MEILHRRALLAGASGLVFASRNDTLLDPHNIRDSWNNIRGVAGLEWMTPHHLRKTALNQISLVFDIETAAAFADHKNSGVTSRHYIERVETVAPDVRAALDELSPRAPLKLVESAS